MQDQIKQLEDELTAVRNDMQFYKTQALELQRQLDAASTGAPVTATSAAIRQLQTLHNDLAADDELAQVREQLEADLATDESATIKALWDRIATLVERKRAEQLRLDLWRMHRITDKLRTENAKLYRRLSAWEPVDE